MDKRICDFCTKKFDFGKEGLSCGNIVVCSIRCAQRSAAKRNHSYTVYDKEDNIIKTNAVGVELRPWLLN